MKKIVIIGATSSIAEHCAKIWVERALLEMVLVGRNQEKLDRICQDLSIRSPKSKLSTIIGNFAEAESIQMLVDDIVLQGTVDQVLIAHGSLPEQLECQRNLKVCKDAIEINGISPVLFAEAFASHFSKNNHGSIIILGSVAGDRGRRSNYVYGAAKGLVTRYAQGLQHRFAGSNVKVTLVKPGPTDTPMTANLKEQGAKLASVEDVAKIIVDSADRGAGVVYAPSKWRLIMMIIRHLPQFIFNKMNI